MVGQSEVPSSPVDVTTPSCFHRSSVTTIGIEASETSLRNYFQLSPHESDRLACRLDCSLHGQFDDVLRFLLYFKALATTVL